MNSREESARKAIAAALRLRISNGYGLCCPVPVFDLVEQLGIELRFAAIPSLEGMYCKSESPAIIIGSERPAGRRTFTCAHELGHHVFGHGTRVDQVLTGIGPQNAEERMANLFAAFLLMPKTALLHALSRRGLDPLRAGPAELFALAGWFGVGYATLIKQLEAGIGVLPRSRAGDLVKCQPKTIKKHLLGFETDSEVTVLDEHWDDEHAIDLEVGDFIIAPVGTVVHGPGVIPFSAQDRCLLLRAEQPGVSRLERPKGRATFVRAARKRFEGRSIFRHLEEIHE